MSGRRGMSLMELIVACGLLATLASVLIPTLQGIARARTELLLKELAIRELRNLAERGLAGEEPSSLRLSSTTEQLLPGPELVVTVLPEPETSLERIRMSLSWEDSVGQRIVPVELNWWRISAGEEP